MALENRFGWSISRESMFDACRRRYYFHYYLSWGGWNGSAPILSREAFRLKRLISLSLWRGQLVHYVTTKVLASMRAKGKIPLPEDVTGYIKERFDKQFEFSRRKMYLSEPKKRGGKLNIDWLALFEHEYGRELETGRVERARNECIEGMEGLLYSPILEDIMLTDSSKWTIENIDLAEFAQVFRFSGADVFAKTDFIFRGRDGSFNIVDWKTFRKIEPPSGERPLCEEEEGRARVQLGVYGYYAAEVLGEPVETIRLYEVNLLDGGKTVEYLIDGEKIEAFKDHIVNGIDKLSSVLVSGDISRNEPLAPESFPRTESGLCRYCNFFRICLQEGTHPHLD